MSNLKIILPLTLLLLVFSEGGLVIAGIILLISKTMHCIRSAPTLSFRTSKTPLFSSLCLQIPHLSPTVLKSALFIITKNSLSFRLSNSAAISSFGTSSLRAALVPSKSTVPLSMVFVSQARTMLFSTESMINFN